MVKFLILGCCFLSLSAHAEYRVFRLKITKYVENTEQNSALTSGGRDSSPAPAQKKKYDEVGSHEVISNLDPDQYLYYYILGKDEKVTYVETWRCFGRTNGKDFCPNPSPKGQSPTMESSKAP